MLMTAFAEPETVRTAPTAARRLFFAIPVIGWIARDLMEGDEDNVWYLLVAFFSLWMIAGMTFGLPGFVVPALMLVPICALTLILITWG
jgi:hypothetical protein